MIDDLTLFLFTQKLTQEYPTILTPDNVWIIGITQQPFTCEYYLVFYYDVHAILDRFIQRYNGGGRIRIRYMRYDDFYRLEEIGSGGYGSVYTAKYKKYSEERKLLYSNALYF